MRHLAARQPRSRNVLPVPFFDTQVSHPNGISTRDQPFRRFFIPAPARDVDDSPASAKTAAMRLPLSIQRKAAAHPCPPAAGHADHMTARRCIIVTAALVGVLASLRVDSNCVAEQVGRPLRRLPGMQPVEPPPPAAVPPARDAAQPARPLRRKHHRRLPLPSPPHPGLSHHPVLAARRPKSERSLRRFGRMNRSPRRFAAVVRKY